MLAYSATYVVVPAIVFHGTRSPLLAGVAFAVEGMIRAVLALGAAPLYASLGSRRALLVGEISRLLGLGLLFVAVNSFALPGVIAGSILFQIGMSIIALEQELRCTELGKEAVRGQNGFRLAEVAAMPPVLGLTLLFVAPTDALHALLVLAAAAIVAHLFFARRWFETDFAHAHLLADTKLVESARFILRQPLLWRGLGACVIAFTIFVWVAIAGPFLLEGRSVLGFGIHEASGIAAFKLVIACAGGTGALVWGQIFARSSGARAAIFCSVLAPLLLAASIVAPVDALAVALVAVAVGCLVGTLGWQRAYRQSAAPVHLRTGMTTLFLAADCLGMTIAGLALIAGAPAAFASVLAVLCMVLLMPAWLAAASLVPLRTTQRPR